MILKIYLLKVKDLIKKKKDHAQKTTAKRVKSRRQKKSDDKDLTEVSSLQGNDSDEFIHIPDMPPLEGDDVKEGK